MWALRVFLYNESHDFQGRKAVQFFLESKWQKTQGNVVENNVQALQPIFDSSVLWKEQVA
jgi:hypothetical protein